MLPLDGLTIWIQFPDIHMFPFLLFWKLCFSIFSTLRARGCIISSSSDKCVPNTEWGLELIPTWLSCISPYTLSPSQKNATLTPIPAPVHLHPKGFVEGTVTDRILTGLRTCKPYRSISYFGERWIFVWLWTVELEFVIEECIEYNLNHWKRVESLIRTLMWTHQGDGDGIR